MKKRYIFLGIFFLSVIIVVIGAGMLLNYGCSISSGRYLQAENGDALVVFQNSPIRMLNRTDRNLFEELDSGDEILVFHGAIAESYPGQTGVYAVFKFGDGTIDDIPQNVIEELIELGWLDADAILEILSGTPIIGEKTPYDTTDMLSGTTLKVVDVSTEQKKITIEYSNMGAESIVYGEYIQFEIWTYDGWHTLMPKIENLNVSDIAYFVEYGKTAQNTYSWAVYGDLPKGRYRAIQEVTEELDKVIENKDKKYTLAVEFEIN